MHCCMRARMCVSFPDCMPLGVMRGGPVDGSIVSGAVHMRSAVPAADCCRLEDAAAGAATPMPRHTNATRNDVNDDVGDDYCCGNHVIY